MQSGTRPKKKAPAKTVQGSKTKKPAAKKADVSAKSKPTAAKFKAGAKVELVSSKLAYRGPLFDVYTDHVREPEGIVSRRDVIRHSGSVVILAVETRGHENDPLIVIERQYRHAAGQYMWEVPAGRGRSGSCWKKPAIARNNGRRWRASTSARDFWGSGCRFIWRKN